MQSYSIVKPLASGATVTLVDPFLRKKGPRDEFGRRTGFTLTPSRKAVMSGVVQAAGSFTVRSLKDDIYAKVAPSLPIIDKIGDTVLDPLLVATITTLARKYVLKDEEFSVAYAFIASVAAELGTDYLLNYYNGLMSTKPSAASSGAAAASRSPSKVMGN